VLTEMRPADRVIDSIYLTVSNLERTVNFYRRSLAFKVRHQEADIAYLGVGGRDLLVLHQIPNGIRAHGTTGLYHFAIRVPSREDLARSLQHIIETNTPVQGFADHLVSEAIYLADPEGNGIEVYRDRPRQDWLYDGDQLQMGTEPLDIDGLLSEVDGNAANWGGLAPETRIGHIHLHVSDIAEAEAFYTGVLGFDLVMRYGPSAAFFSLGGYHHHIGVNTWNGEGAPQPPAGSLGLRHFVLMMEEEAEVERISARAEAAGVSVTATELGTQLHDPSANAIVLTVRVG
jgi:catechol 2,3-dioxygenase